MSEPEFVLKTTPPRLPRAALERPRLNALWDTLHDRTAVAVCAPAGYGKTTLIGQWRRRWLEQGALVAWLAVDAQDEPARFTLGLLHALRTASARPGFAVLAAQAAQADADLHTLAALLAEVAAFGGETVLVVDDAERLPEATAAGPLAYLLHNAPPNLHLLLGSRTPIAWQAGGLEARGQLATLRTADLRLRADEALAILGKRFGAKLSLDDAMRLHEASDGWPLGLQLAAAAIELAPDPAAAIASLSGRHADVARWFLESLLSRLPPPLAEFLVAISALEHLHADLCEAATGELLAADWLEQLQLDTPIVAAAELPGWYRLHPLARDFLRGRFEQWPGERRAAVHRRACAWFARAERPHEAACHALAAGDVEQAQAFALRSLWPLATSGRLGEARAWLEHLPEAALAADTETRLVGAWVIALGERNGEAYRIATAVLEDTTAPERLRAIARRVASGAASYADRLGALPDLFPGAPHSAELGDPVYETALAHSHALVALHAGDTLRTRDLCLGMVARYEGPEGMRLALTFSRGLSALAHVWDGQPLLAAEALQPAIDDAERREGRRGVIPCLIAPVLAAARLDLGAEQEARALLAGRFDLVEHVGFPDTLWLGYRTLMRLAMARNDERHALHVLDNLAALAQRRRLPRLAMLGLAEAVRLHALGSRAESAAAALRQLEALAPEFAEIALAPFAAQHRLACALAAAHVALGAGDAITAEARLDEAAALAGAMRRGPERLVVMALRAVAARLRNQANALPLLAEAMSLAELAGYHRLLVDTHPLAVRMAAELRPPAATEAAPRLETVAPIESPPRAAPLVRSGPLTPKEAEILALLDNGLSNKLIARALEISDETVKWHLKNLYLKLAAGSRKHAVDRARLLGLIEG